MWAEAVGFELLVLCLLSSSQRATTSRYMATTGGSSRDGGTDPATTNHQPDLPAHPAVIRELQQNDTHEVCSKCREPADPPSRGRYPPHELLLEDFNIPSELRPSSSVSALL
ncbi:hypothetical protein BJV77DRAFT_1028848, partial [Russula vinacea]